MNKKIFAIWGVADVGKTITIKKTYALLKKENPQYKELLYEEQGSKGYFCYY